MNDFSLRLLLWTVFLQKPVVRFLQFIANSTIQYLGSFQEAKVYFVLLPSNLHFRLKNPDCLNLSFRGTFFSFTSSRIVFMLQFLTAQCLQFLPSSREGQFCFLIQNSPTLKLENQKPSQRSVSLKSFSWSYSTDCLILVLFWTLKNLE